MSIVNNKNTLSLRALTEDQANILYPLLCKQLIKTVRKSQIDGWAGLYRGSLTDACKRLAYLMVHSNSTSCKRQMKKWGYTNKSSECIQVIAYMDEVVNKRISKLLTQAGVMSEIKRGALVKTWDENIKDFTIGNFHYVDDRFGFVVSTASSTVLAKNAIEIPADIAKQLEELGR